MPANPVSVIIKGIVIPNVSGFRYGQQLLEQRFFELKFRQPLLASLLSFSADDAASYTNQPITLQFEGAFGKLESVSGTIVKLEYINTPGQQAEVVVAGTMYRPSGNVSKFTLAVIGLLLLPILFTGGLWLHVTDLSRSLVKKEGTVRSFQDRSGRGSHYYTFKIAPYRASFYREYHSPVLKTARDNIDALFTAGDGSYDGDRRGQTLDFYISGNKLSGLNDPRQKVDFFYMKSPSEPLIKFDYYYDILIYTTNKTSCYILWIVYLMLEVVCFTGALFCYKMYALDQQRKNRIIWYTCMLFAALFNVAVLAMMI